MLSPLRLSPLAKAYLNSEAAAFVPKGAHSDLLEWKY